MVEINTNLVGKHINKIKSKCFGRIYFKQQVNFQNLTFDESIKNRNIFEKYYGKFN